MLCVATMSINMNNNVFRSRAYGHVCGFGLEYMLPRYTITHTHTRFVCDSTCMFAYHLSIGSTQEHRHSGRARAVVPYASLF